MSFNALCRNATYHRVLLSISKRALKMTELINHLPVDKRVHYFYFGDFFVFYGHDIV